MKRVTQFVAITMAKQVFSNLEKANQKAKSDTVKKAEESRKFSKLQALHERRDELSKQIKQITEEVQKEFAVTIGTYPSLFVTARANNLPKFEDVKQRIILASHVDNVPVETLEKAVFNEFKKSSGL